MTKERCRSPQLAGPTGRAGAGREDAPPRRWDAPSRRFAARRAFVWPLLAVTSLLLTWGCQGFGTRDSRGGVEGDLETPSWEDPVAAIFVQHCNECHAAPPRNSAPDYLRTDSLDDVGDVMGVRNQIERHIERAGSNAAPMPPAPRPRMSRAELRTLERWLELGMPETKAQAIVAAGGTAPDAGGTGGPDAGGSGDGPCDRDVQRERACVCTSGASGTQRCTSDGEWRACECDDDDGAGSVADAGGESDGADAGVADAATDAAGADADPGPPPVFADVVAAVFSRRCSNATCHGSRGEDPNLVDGDVYTRLLGPSNDAVGMPWITPGDPDQSYLYLKTRSDFRSLGIGSGRVMPIGTALTASQRDVLLRWIEGGAQP